MAHVHDSRQAADGAGVDVVEAELAAGQGEDDGVGRGLLYEVGKVVASGLGAVAAADQEEVADGALLHGVDDRPGDAEHCAVGESAGQLGAAVDTRQGCGLAVAAQFAGLGDYGREVLVAGRPGCRGRGVDVVDMHQPGKAHHRGGVYPVGVGLARRHQAVGGEQHRCRQVIKLALLVLPGRAEVAF